MSAIFLYSSAEVAARIGINQSSLGKVARQHKIGKLIGGVYVFNQEEADRLVALAHPTKGNPNWIAAKKPEST